MFNYFLACLSFSTRVWTTWGQIVVYLVCIPSADYPADNTENETYVDGQLDRWIQMDDGTFKLIVFL